MQSRTIPFCFAATALVTIALASGPVLGAQPTFCGTSSNSYTSGYFGNPCSGFFSTTCTASVALPAGARPGCFDIIFLNGTDNGPAPSGFTCPSGWTAVPVAKMGKAGSWFFYGSQQIDSIFGCYHFHKAGNPAKVDFQWKPNGGSATVTTYVAASYCNVDQAAPINGALTHMAANQDTSSSTTATAPSVTPTGSTANELDLQIYAVGNSPCYPKGYRNSLGTVRVTETCVGGQGTVLIDGTKFTSPTGDQTLSWPGSPGYWGGGQLVLNGTGSPIRSPKP